MSPAGHPWRASGTSLYIHVPFCASKCRYCDFHSRGGALSAEEAHAFVDGMLERIEIALPVLSHVPTIYIGGGTPTLLGAELVRLVRALREISGAASRAGVGSEEGGPESLELSVEANPDSLSPELAWALAQAGVTRVSLGVQSLDDTVLRWLGRRHDAAASLSAMASVRGAGMDLSVDLMCGIPEQSAESLEADLKACAAEADHISVYPLTVEDETPLASAIEAGLVSDCDADVASSHMILACELLAAAGLERYEVASYARPNHRCRHNLRYWTGGSYLGVGPSAASMLTGAQVRELPFGEWSKNVAADARVRFVDGGRASSGGDYPFDDSSLEVMTPEDAVREDAMLGLRLTQGISEELARCAGITHVLCDLADRGLVVNTANRWIPTERGWLLGNELYGAIWMG